MGNSEFNIDKNEKVETVKLITRSCKRVFGSNIYHEAILINNKYIVENGDDNENYDKQVESNELILYDNWNFFNDKRNICWDTAKRVKDRTIQRQNERESTECKFTLIEIGLLLCICCLFCKGA